VNSFLTRFFQITARIFFVLTILLIPFRLRLTLWTRPFFPIYSDYTDFLLFASDAAMLLMLGFWVCALILETRPIRAGNTIVFFLLVWVTIAAWVSSLGSVDPVITRYHAVRFSLLLLFYLYIVNEVTSAYWVVAPVALQGLIQMPVAVWQFFSQSSLGLQRFGEHVLNPLVLGTSILPVNGERILRAYGLADHPNILGGCFAFVLVLLLAVVLYGKKRDAVFAGISFAAIFPALLLTFSRSAWVGLFVAAVFLVLCEVFAQRWDAFKKLALLGGLSLMVAFPIFNGNLSVFDQRFNSGNVAEDHPMNERAYLLNAGNTLFVEHSAIGVGVGASPLAMKLRFENFRINYQPPHFTPLTSSLETGVIGGAPYLLLMISPAIFFIFKWREYVHKPFIMGALALLIVISVVNLFDYYTWMYAPGRLWQWMAWGLYSAAMDKAD